MNQKKENLLIRDNVENKKLSGERVIWIELLRIFACFCVILWHVSARHFESISNGPSIWYVFVFFNTIARCSVPLFVMISGLLYLDNSREISIRKLYSKNILNILFLYVFWCLFYGFLDIIMNSSYTGHGMMILKDVIKNAIIKPKYHLWYLPTLMGVIVVVPILREVFSKDSSKRICEYTLLILFMLRILKITILTFDIPKIEYLKNVLNIINFEVFGGDWIFCFLLGYYLFNYEVSKRIRKVLYLLGFLAFAASIIFTIYSSLKVGKITTKFYKSNAIFIVLYSTGIFMFFKSIVSKINITQKARKIIMNISGATLGIYLIYPLFNDILFYKLKVNLLTFTPILTVSLMTTVVFILSFLVTKILKKIKIMNRHIV